MNKEIIKFVNGGLQIDVTVSPNEETVWLTQKQMAELFDVKSQAITRHLKAYTMIKNYSKKQLVLKWNKLKLKVVVK